MKESLVNRRLRQGKLALIGAICLAGIMLLPAGAKAQNYDFFGFDDFFAKAHQPTTQNLAYALDLQAPAATWNAVQAAPDVYRAGAHPDASTAFRITPGPDGRAIPTSDILIDGPPGFVGSTTAVPACPMADFLDGRLGNCSNLSQVGLSSAVVHGTDPRQSPGSNSPIFKLPPPADAPARFGYRTANGETVFIVPRLRSDGDYGLRIHVEGLFNGMAVLASASTLWGVPYDPIHNVHRVIDNTDSLPGGTIPARVERKVFLTNPTYCDSGPLARSIHARPWAAQDLWAHSTVFGDQAPDRCDDLEFGTVRAPASLTAQPTHSRADTPTGLEVNLRLPFNEDPDGLANPALRHTEVELPDGLALNPSAASGLRACTNEQIGLLGTDFPEPHSIRFSLDAPRCPDASKVADVEVISPLLADPLHGSMYLAEQIRNPLGSLMAIYLYVEGQGVSAKIAGRVDRDPVTGQVTSTFHNNPQLPFTDLKVRFKAGARAPLVSPRTCGTYETATTLTPWSHPHTGPPVVWRDGFQVASGAGAHPCVSDVAARPFNPGMSAGARSAMAGVHSPFVVRFTRGDGEQEFDRITAVTPEGLSGKLKGVPYCPEAGIARAIGRDGSGEGRVEQADPSCGEASRVGTTVIGVGSGPEPYYASGKVYLAGPYKGAPLSMVFIVPAVAGPFDLGVQVVRAALNINPRTAQITTVSDEIPKILEGVPLRIRDIRVLIDRPEFTLNPTNCEQKQVRATVFGTNGAASELANHFRVGDCAALGFNPRFNIRILDRGRRSTVRSWNPRTRFTVVPRPGDANMGPTVVTLPSSVILDQSNIRTLCTRAQFAERNCPQRAIYGYAKAWSPLLDEPLEGPVYMQANGGVRPLPDILADLDGQVRVNLEGWIDTVRRGETGRLRNRFTVVPDVPVTRFVLTMRGGRNRGLLVNSTDLCRTNERGVARFRSASGKVDVQRPRVGMTFRGCRKVRRQAARRAAKRKAARQSVARKSAVRSAPIRSARASKAAKEARNRR